MAGVTIYDVAARAGVSIKSVSRVVNGEANVSDALREKVDAAVAALGYRRSLSARSLAGSSSSIIAALVDAELTIEHWRSGRGNDYLSRLELGLLIECRQADHYLMVELVDYAASTLKRDLSALLSAIRPVGVVLTPPNSDNPEVLDLLESAGVAYARIGPMSELSRGICIRMDERRAAWEITSHLIELGHRRIAHLSGPESYSASRERRSGFEAAMHEHGLTVSSSTYVEGDFTFLSGVRAGQGLMEAEQRPTAVFAANDDMALGVIQAVSGAGLRVPEDVSVAGFDDTPSAVFSTPGLTTIRQPVAEMATAACRRLIPSLKSRLGAKVDAERELTPYELIIRGSTGIPPA